MRCGWVAGMVLTQTLICWVQPTAGGGLSDGSLRPEEFDCPCPIWAINFTKRRLFCGREFRGTTGKGCAPNAVYHCLDPKNDPRPHDPDAEVFANTGLWASAYIIKCPHVSPVQYCGLDCKGGSKNSDDCEPVCYYSESEAKKSIDDVYNSKRPWERSRGGKGTKRNNRTKSKHSRTKH